MVTRTDPVPVQLGKSKVRTGSERFKALTPGSVVGEVPFSVSGDGFTDGSHLLDTRKQVVSAVAESAETDSELARWGKNKKLGVRVADLLDQGGYQDRASHRARSWKIRHCGSTLVRYVSKCPHHHTVIRSASLHCQDRLCPVCASRRASRLADQWERGLKFYLAEHPGLCLSFVTVTVADTEELPEYKRLTKSLRKFWKSEFWQGYGIRAHLSAFEIKQGRGSKKWHAHFHCIVVHQRPIPLITTGKHTGEYQNTDNELMAEAWSEACGGLGRIVKGETFTVERVKEVVKYVVKSADTLSPEKLVDLAVWSRGLRFLIPGGEFYGNKSMRAVMDQDEEKHEHGPGGPCPKCGCCDYDEEVMPYREDLGEYVISRVRDYLWIPEEAP